MATVIATKSTVSSSTKDATIPKPADVAVGDMLVAFVSCIVAGDYEATFTAPAGWTQVQGIGTSNLAPLFTFAKIATSTETAATEFAFTGSSEGTDNAIGIMLRITNPDGFTSVAANIKSAASYGATYAGITGAPVNSLLLMSFAQEGATTDDWDFASYAVATNNPSWTEEYDIYNCPSGVADNHALASATYTGGDTGNYTCSKAGTACAGTLLSVLGNVNVTATPTVIDLTLSIQAPTVIGGATVSPTVVDLTLSIQAPTVTEIAPKWTNSNKSAAPSYTNTDKSTAPTWTNTDKSAAPTVTNTNKS